MPVICIRNRIATPVGRLKILKYNAHLRVLIGSVAAHVKIAPTCAGLGSSRTLEPGVLVGGMIEDQLRNDAQAMAVRLIEKQLEIAHGAIGWMNFGVARDVVAIIPPG